MLRGRKVINSDEYIIEVAGRITEEKYKFRIQTWSRKAKVASFSGFVSEDFIEDFINNNKNIDYLEQLTLNLAKDHLKDILELPGFTVAKKLQYWFKEAKRQLNEEK